MGERSTVTVAQIAADGRAAREPPVSGVDHSGVLAVWAGLTAAHRLASPDRSPAIGCQGHPVVPRGVWRDALGPPPLSARAVRSRQIAPIARTPDVTQ